MRTSSTSDSILLLARSGPVTNDAVARALGLKPTDAGARLYKLTAAGKLIQLRPQYQGERTRWELAPPGHPKPPKGVKPGPKQPLQPRPQLRPEQVLAPPPGKAVTLRKPQKPAAAAFRDQVAVCPAGVKVTRGPSYSGDPRYQVLPGEQVFGAGFSAVGIGRDVETGRGWGEGA